MSSPKIKHGYYNTFYAFKLFDSDLKGKEYSKILNLLTQSILIISTETPQKEVRFNDQFSTVLEERRKIFREHKSNSTTLPRYLKESITEISDKPEIQIIPGPKSIEIIAYDNLEDNLEYSQHTSLSQLATMYASEEQYTGLPAKDYKNRFALFPPLIFKDDKYFHPSIFLTVFKNGYATLHYSMEIESLSFEEININAWNLKFDSLYLPGFLKNENTSEMKRDTKLLNIFSLLYFYSEYIKQFTTSLNTPEIGCHFHNLVLNDFAFAPKNFEEKLSPNYLENIYKLLFAPIQQHQLKSNVAIESIIKNLFYSFSKTHLIYANNNRSLNVYSTEFKDLIKMDPEETEILKDPYSLNLLIQNSSLGANITAIELILLKKLVTQQVSVFELKEETSLRKLLNIQLKENVDYSIDFSKYYFVYASVRDLIKFFEEKCEDFLLLNLMNERREKIEKVISLKKEKDIARFTALGPFLTLIFTLLFSFPALDSILKSFEKEEYLHKVYISLNLVSSFLVLYLYKNKLKELHTDIFIEYLPKFKYKILVLQVKYFIVLERFIDFLNRDYKEASKDIYSIVRSKMMRENW